MSTLGFGHGDSKSNPTPSFDRFKVYNEYQADAACIEREDMETSECPSSRTICFGWRLGSVMGSSGYSFVNLVVSSS
jgi:hypothetical protein